MIERSVITEHLDNAVSFDLDGVIFKRLPFQGEAFLKHLLHGDEIYKTFKLPSSPFKRELSDQPFSSILELMKFYYVRGTGLKEGVKKFIGMEAMQADLFLNTARPAKKIWAAMTEKHLQEKGLNNELFKGSFYKPEGMQAKMSKALAIRELIDRGYENITHYDDNPEDVLSLALMFPKVQFVIVQDLSTGMLFSRKEAKKYPNVRRIACFDKEKILQPRPVSIDV